MEIEIICYFCFENFSINLDYFHGENIEIWDCEVCCNPNKIHYCFFEDKLTKLEISSGNE
tara:strand:+ start:646 stop:825 length:180 start_codon:yes stop_codon:yes gene_type:complete